MENIPFADTIFTRSGPSANRPLLLIEPSNRISGDDKNKSSARLMRNVEKDAKVEAVSTPDSKADTNSGSVSSLDPKTDHKTPAMSTSETSLDPTASVMQRSDTNTGSLASDGTAQNNSEVLQLKHESTGGAGKGTLELNSEGVTHHASSTVEKPSASSMEAGSERMEISSAPSQTKQACGRAVASPTIPMPYLKENIILGVALEGSKRMLPIEEEMASSPTIELTAARNGSESPPISNDKKEGPNASNS